MLIMIRMHIMIQMQPIMRILMPIMIQITLVNMNAIQILLLLHQLLLL